MKYYQPKTFTTEVETSITLCVSNIPSQKPTVDPGDLGEEGGD